MEEAKARLPLGERLPNGTEAYYAGIIGGKLLAFRDDYRFANEILANRLRRLRSRSSFSQPWREMLRLASDRFGQLLNAGWSRTDAREQWARNDVPRLRSWLATQPEGFQMEVDQYGPDFLDKLVHGGSAQMTAVSASSAATAATATGAPAATDADVTETTTVNGRSTVNGSPKGRLSQRRADVFEHGLVWGGRTFKGRASFERWLKAHGSTWEEFAARHGEAAKALSER